MKKLLAVLVVVALALVAVSAADAAITYTRHNLSSGSTNALTGNINEICIFCHTPHAGTQAAGQPLWNRYTTTATFNAYTATTLSGTPNGATNPASQLCFSCHDGVTSINALRNYNGSAWTGILKQVGGNYNVGGDASSLTNDHPIGMPIPSKTGYNTSPGTLGGYLVGASRTVECSTCHAVHGTTQGFGSLLRMSNANSLLCLDCHVK